MKKLLISALTLLMLGTTVIGCSSGDKATASIDADGLVLNVGETKVSEVKTAGYTYEWTSMVYEEQKEMKGKTFSTSAISFSKNGEEYIGSGVINKNASSTPLDDCLVGDTTIYMHYEGKHKFTSVKIDGKDIAGKTKDEVKALFEKEPNIDEDYLYYVNDKNTYTIEFGDDGKVDNIHIDVNEDKL